MPSGQQAEIYFDHNATTPVAPAVREAMLPYLSERYGNASSIHRLGQQARAAVNHAREQVAALLHAAPGEIIFTSGGTEADNLPILGAARLDSRRSRHVITSAFEHAAVIYAGRALEREGVAVTYLPITPEGFVEPAAVRAALRPETVLISVMHANNEVGTIQPIAEIAAIARQAGVLMHTDAVQSVGKIPVDVRALGVDLLSLSAHKIYGPKGSGAVYVRKDVKLRPILFGGHGEDDPRPGTENVAGIVGLGAAAELCVQKMSTESLRLSRLRDRLEQGLVEAIPRCGVNGSRRAGVRVPNTTSMYFDGLDAEALIIEMDLEGIACSRGAACSAATVEPSHVLLAMGVAPARALSSVRISLGHANTEEHIDYALRTFPRVVERLRALAPD